MEVNVDKCEGNGGGAPRESATGRNLTTYSQKTKFQRISNRPRNVFVR